MRMFLRRIVRETEVHKIWSCSNNILYPKEDRENKVLLYAYRNCDHQKKYSICMRCLAAKPCEVGGRPWPLWSEL